MKKQFYSHLISYESIRLEMNGLDLSEKEKDDLLKIVESHVHHTMLDEALSHVRGEDKKAFLLHVHQEEHDKAMTILRKHTQDIEKHLLQATHVLFEGLRDDIRELKKKKTQEE